MAAMVFTVVAVTALALWKLKLLIVLRSRARADGPRLRDRLRDFFVFASAAYWIFERDDAVRLVTSLIPRAHRKTVSNTWDLIDLKLGAYVRGQLLLIVLVATVLSVAFAAIGLPFWLLIAAFAGVVEIVPVIGPFVAGALAVAVGFTESVEVGIAAGLIVLVVRMIEDYFVIPHVLGDAVGLSPLLVIVSVAATARPCSSRPRTRRREARALRPAPAAEDEAADSEAETEGPERERPQSQRLPHPREPLPAPERLFFLARQRLPAPLFPQRAARSKAEIEVVEDLGWLIHHGLSV